MIIWNFYPLSLYLILDWCNINKFPMGNKFTLFCIMFELLSSIMRDQCSVLLQYRMTTTTLLREQLGSFESRSLDRMVRKQCTIFLLATLFILSSHNKRGHTKCDLLSLKYCPSYPLFTLQSQILVNQVSFQNS